MKKVTQPSPLGEGEEMDSRGHGEGAAPAKAEKPAPKADKK